MPSKQTYVYMRLFNVYILMFNVYILIHYKKYIQRYTSNANVIRSMGMTEKYSIETDRWLEGRQSPKGARHLYSTSCQSSLAKFYNRCPSEGIANSLQ